MTSSELPAVTTAPITAADRQVPWYRPTISPEHGVYVVLLVSFFTGAAAAQQWTLATTLALISAVAGFQAEHPWVLQIKQRRSWKPRFLVWGGVYTTVAGAIAAFLAWQTPALVWIYVAAVGALGVDAIAVYYRQQKAIANEFLTFAAVCLTTPLAYEATTGTLEPWVMSLWLLNTLFFSSAIFTVKLRKPRTAAVLPGVIYHVIASLMVVGLVFGGALPPATAAAFGWVLGKYGFILARRTWYQTTAIRHVALLETGTALLFFVVVGLSLLPAHLL